MGEQGINTFRKGRIVVGVDGSAKSRAALRWAADEALLRGAELWVVHAWTVPATAGGVPTRPPSGAAATPYRAAAENLLNEVIEQTLGPDQGRLPLQRRLVEQQPAAALVRLSHDADLLVVGAYGRGRLLTALLGTLSPGAVTPATMHRAACPIVIVPG